MPHTLTANKCNSETNKPGDLQSTFVENAGPRRILIVDDHKNVTVTLKKSLEKLPGYEVFTAFKGEQALHLIKQQPFDLILTDYCLPGIDGLTLAAQIRQLYPQMAIVMITVYATDELREQAAYLSIHAVLDKPATLAEIRQVASEALQEAGML